MAKPLSKKQKIKTIVFNGIKTFLVKDKYNDGKTLLNLISSENIEKQNVSIGDLIIRITINIPSVILEKDEIIVNENNENRGILKILVKEKIVEPTVKFIETGFGQAQICKLI